METYEFGKVYRMAIVMPDRTEMREFICKGFDSAGQAIFEPVHPPDLGVCVQDNASSSENIGD